MGMTATRYSAAMAARQAARNQINGQYAEMVRTDPGTLDLSVANFQERRRALITDGYVPRSR